MALNRLLFSLVSWRMLVILFPPVPEPAFAHSHGEGENRQNPNDDDRDHDLLLTLSHHQPHTLPEVPALSRALRAQALQRPMPHSGSITFGDLIGKLDVLRVECATCGPR